MDWIEITTLNQLLFHLKNGEVVVCPFPEGDMFIRSEGDKYLFIVQPPFKKATELVGGLEQLEKTFRDFREKGIRFWVLPGAELRKARSFWEGFIVGVRRFIARWF